MRTRRKTEPRGPAAPPDRAAWLLPGVFALALVAYAPGLNGPFIFDDATAIPHNPHIRQLWPLTQALTAPTETTAAGRPVVCLTLALNYALGGLDVRGYHTFNLLIHLAATALVFALVRRTLRSPVLRQRFGPSAGGLALSVSALWALHPLQTESVVYVIQRTELLMGLFYLLVLYGVARGAASQRPRAWSLVAIAAGVLGMASKESMVTVPVVALLYDRTFFAGSFATALRRRPGLYLGLALGWVVLAALMLKSPRGSTVGFGHHMNAASYLWTQAGVILWYLRLALCPYPLVLSYADWPVAHTITKALLPGAAIVGLFAATGWALVRRPPLGFLGAWFFLILAPTSSFVPIVTEVAAERRMYLPLLAVVVLVVLLGAWLLSALPARGVLRRSGAAVVVLLVGACAAATFARSRDYRSDVDIWQDTVDKRPANWLAHMNLGNALVDAGRPDDSVPHYEIALKLQPKDARTHINLANMLLTVGRLDEALASYATGVAQDPDNAEMQYNYAVALAKAERVAEAIERYRTTLRFDPRHIGAWNNLGFLLAGQRRFDEALECYARALELDPRQTMARYNRANALLDLKRLPEAADDYRRVLAAEPRHAGAHYNLGITLAMQGQLDAGIAEVREALRINPQDAQAQRVLQEMLMRQAVQRPRPQ